MRGELQGGGQRALTLIRPAPWAVPASLYVFSATAVLGTAWLPLQMLKQTRPTVVDHKREHNGPSEAVGAGPIQGSVGTVKDGSPFFMACPLLKKKNKECGGSRTCRPHSKTYLKPQQ